MSKINKKIIIDKLIYNQQWTLKKKLKINKKYLIKYCNYPKINKKLQNKMKVNKKIDFFF